MKKLLPILVLAVLGLGAAFAWQLQQNAKLERRLAQLQHENAEARAQSAAELERLQSKVETYRTATEQLETRNRELAAGAPAPAAAAPATGAGTEGKERGFAGMMKKMFTDPEMKKAMRSQQAMAMQMMYGDLAKELGLAPEDARHVMELLADRQMALAGASMQLIDGDGNEMETQGKKIAADKEEYDKQIAAVLGEDGYKKFSEYERTIGDRMQLQQFKQAFAANGTPLEEAQATGLLGIMKEERLREPPSPFDPASQDPAAAMKAMQSDEVFDKLMANQEAFSRRVLNRASTVLSPDQMTQFEQIQKQQIEMQKMGMRMGREMMKGNRNSPPPTPPAPPQPVEVEAR